MANKSCDHIQEIRDLKERLQRQDAKIETIYQNSEFITNQNKNKIKQNINQIKKDITHNQNSIILIITLAIAIPYTIFWSKSFWSYHNNYSILTNLVIYLFLITIPIIVISTIFLLSYMILSTQFRALLKTFTKLFTHIFKFKTK